MATKKLSDEIAPGTTVEIPIADLRTYKRNPRKGNVGAIAASLRAHTQYRPITANIGTHTGRTLEVLKGNHTLMAFRELSTKFPDEGWDKIKVFLVDVDEDQAAKIVLADNQTSAKGGYDNDVLAGLLHDVGDDLTGLGYTAADLDALTQFDTADSGDIPDEAYVEIDGEDEPTESKGRGQAVISYSLVFDTVAQKREWLDFLVWLKGRYPDLSLPARIVAYIESLADESDD